MTRRGRNPAKNRARGVTLIEMLVVVAILGVMTAVGYPSITAGLDSLRLNTASDDVRNLFAAAANQAQRRQQWVEIRISGHRLEAFASGYARMLELRDVSLSPERSYFIDPLGTLPGAVVDLRGSRGAIRRVRIDPISGVAEVSEVSPDATP